MKMNLIQHFFNPNPRYKASSKNWNCSDGIIRTVCAATGKSWREAYQYVVDVTCSAGYTFYDNEGIDMIIRSLGYRKVSLVRGEKKPSVESFCSNHANGEYIIRTSYYPLYIKDGEYYDCFEDWNERCIHCYYEKIR